MTEKVRERMGYKLNECKIAVHVHNRQDGGFDVHIEIFDVATGETVSTLRKGYTNLSLTMLQHFTRQKAYDLARDCGYDHVKQFISNISGKEVYEV